MSFEIIVLLQYIFIGCFMIAVQHLDAAAVFEVLSK